jgi:cytoskeletal protein CcmA (bactofilin family)
MACPNEFTWAMYADGELPEDEARRVREHWTECQSCRELASALDGERRALVLSLQEIDLVGFAPQAAAPSRPRRAAAELAVFACGAALVARLAIDAVTGVALPPSAEWMNPFRLAGLLNLSAASIVYMVNEGGPMLMSLINNLGFVAIAALILLGASRVLRRSVAAAVLLGTIVLSLAFSTPVSAIEHRGGGQGPEAVVVAAGETIDDTLVAVGDSVIIEGTITGDLITGARRVVIRGKVQGDVISAGQTIEVDGVVEGNFYGWAQNIQIRGQLARNLYGFGQEVVAARQSEIRGNATGFAQQMTVDGNVGRDVTAFVQRVDVGGKIASNLLAHAQYVTVMAPARIAGNLVAEVPNTGNFKIESGTSVGGKTDLRTARARPSQYATAWFYIWQGIWLAAAFITGLALFWLFPEVSSPGLNARSALLTAGAIGFVAAVAIPVAAVFVGITMVGLPLALVSFALWLLGLYLAKIVVAVFVGRALVPAEGTSAAIALLA